MLLQRQRISESQLMDQQTRRILHDEILPELHTIMLSLSEGKEFKESSSTPAIKALSALHHQIADLLHKLPKTTSPQVAKSGLVGAIRHMIDDDYENQFHTVNLTVSPIAESKASEVPLLTAEVLFYATREALRNAADHGGGGTLAQPVNVEIAVTWQEGLKIVITDDGVGLEKSIQGQLDHQPKTGKGQGLALHSTMMAVIGGSLMVESRPGQSTSIILELPAESWQFFRYP